MVRIKSRAFEMRSKYVLQGSTNWVLVGDGTHESHEEKFNKLESSIYALHRRMDEVVEVLMK